MSKSFLGLHVCGREGEYGIGASVYLHSKAVMAWLVAKSAD